MFEADPEDYGNELQRLEEDITGTAGRKHAAEHEHDGERNIFSVGLREHGDVYTVIQEGAAHYAGAIP